MILDVAHYIEEDDCSEYGSGCVVFRQSDADAANPDKEADDISGVVNLLKNGWVSVLAKNGERTSIPPDRIDVILWRD